MAQPPGYNGWYGQAGQPPVGYNPYGGQAPTAPGYGPNLGFGWQDPSAATAPPYISPAPPSFPPGGGGGGLGFESMMNNQFPGQVPQMGPPPPMATAPDDTVCTEQPDQTQAFPGQIKVIREKPGRSPRPERPPRPVHVVAPDSSTPSSASGDHRQTSSYQKGLQDMADLMKDVELTEDVMNEVRGRFKVTDNTK